MGSIDWRRWWLAGVAALASLVGLWQLVYPERPLEVRETRVGRTPVTVFSAPGAVPGPGVVIAHGFAGSQTLMRSLAVTLAWNGYTVATFDFLGHGRHPEPIEGDVQTGERVTAAFIAQLDAVAGFTRGLAARDELAVIGHSMASDIVVRWAQQQGRGVTAVVTLSMMAPTVDARSPPNLLVVTGGLEGEGLRAMGLGAVEMVAEQEVLPGMTVGDFQAGTARRAVFPPGVEHVGVLYSRVTLEETLGWLDTAFARAGPNRIVVQGAWLLLLFAGLVALARPLSRLLPVVAAPPVGGFKGWQRLWLPLALPAVVTPLVLRFLPTDLLPLLLGDYLVTHFALYGFITLGLLRFQGAFRRPPTIEVHYGGLLLAALLVALFGLFVIGLAIDRFVTTFWPIPERWPLVLAMLIGTVPYFLADEWLTRGPGRALGVYPSSKLVFLLSLGIAIALDFDRLFFLVMIVPIILAFFLVFGLISAWVQRRTGHPWVAALANAVVFAVAVAVTFPMVVA